MTMAGGKEHSNKAARAMAISEEYFRDIGAKVADKKCFMGSTCPSTREALRQMKWDEEGNKVIVVNHFRDLGFHLCLDNSGAATTISERIGKAIKAVKRLRFNPLSRRDKARIVQSNILPAALYGIEGAGGCNAQI